MSSDFVPCLTVTVICPLQPSLGATEDGSVSVPEAMNLYGALRSRDGASLRLSERAVNGLTVTDSTAVAVWPAVSVATASSALRPTSDPRGAYAHANGAAVTSHSSRSSS